jgi:hypothetical protein
MDSQISTALIVLGVTVISALGTLVKLLVDKLSAELATNTSVSMQARDASNGQLSELLAQLAAERNCSQGLRAIIHDRDDRIAYLLARLPEASALMAKFAERRTTKITPADVQLAEQHALGSDTLAFRDPGQAA